MGYSRAPQVATYQTKMVSLAHEMNNRSTLPTTDVDYVNCFFESTKNKETNEQSLILRQRDGSSVFITVPGVGPLRGIYYWEDLGRLFVASGHDVFIFSMPTGAPVASLFNVFPTTSVGDVGMVDYLYDTGIVKIVITDGTTLSTVDSANAVVVGADPDMPVHLPQIVYLDGYLFMVKAGTADLYNSNLNDPLVYTAGDFLSSEILADKATYLLKLNNYILLFGNDSIEYFWDAANDSGSPLQRNDTPVKLTGFAGGVAQLGNKVYFVGDANHSQRTIYVLEDFKITDVGTEPIRRYLSGATDGFQANLISISGHDFYVLYAGMYTYVLELSTNLWARWIFGAATNAFKMGFSSCFKIGSTYLALFTLEGSQALYRFDPTLGQDAGATLTSIAILDNNAFDTYNRKFMYRLTVWSDRTSGSNPLLIQWSDDDYQTYNSGITLELNQEIPCIYRLGQFRRRAFKLTHSANQPLRLMGLEADINMGQT